MFKIPLTPRAPSDHRGIGHDGVDFRLGEVLAEDSHAVPEGPRPLDVFHDPGDKDLSPSATASTSTSRPLTYLSTKTGCSGETSTVLFHVLQEFRFVVDYSLLPVRPIRRMGERGRESPVSSLSLRPRRRNGRPALRLEDARRLRSCSNFSRSSARSIALHRGAQNRHARLGQGPGQVDGRLAAELGDNPQGVFPSRLLARTSSTVKGSKYSLSEVSKSVDTVSDYY